MNEAGNEARNETGNEAGIGAGKNARRERSDQPRRFFSEEEQRRIVVAIRAAEKRTSGEIRLHVEREVPRTAPILGDAYARARQLFAALGMHRTATRNGVLIAMSLRDRRVAVVGDEKLHDVVGEAYWRGIVATLTREFAAVRYCEGLLDAIARIGEVLRERFPRRENDVNELRDDISYGD